MLKHITAQKSRKCISKSRILPNNKSDIPHKAATDAIPIKAASDNIPNHLQSVWSAATDAIPIKATSDRQNVMLRSLIFRKLLHFLEIHPSRLFARIEIQILLLATAKGFRRRGTCILFSKDPLKKYADFTKACMQSNADRKRLYRISLRLGRLIRKLVGFTNLGDLEQLIFLLYRNIGITMTGEIPGQILVSECFFSNIYTAGDCRFISAMDAGIIAGICGTGKLIFSDRITEGCMHCIAKTYSKDYCKVTEKDTNKTVSYEK